MQGEVGPSVPPGRGLCLRRTPKSLCAPAAGVSAYIEPPEPRSARAGWVTEQPACGGRGWLAAEGEGRTLA